MSNKWIAELHPSLWTDRPQKLSRETISLLFCFPESILKQLLLCSREISLQMLMCLVFDALQLLADGRQVLSQRRTLSDGGLGLLLLIVSHHAKETQTANAQHSDTFSNKNKGEKRNRTERPNQNTLLDTRIIKTVTQKIRQKARRLRREVNRSIQAEVKSEH